MMTTKLSILQIVIIFLSFMVAIQYTCGIPVISNEDDKWIIRSKFTDSDDLNRLFAKSISIKQKPNSGLQTLRTSSISEDAQAVKMLNPRVREAINQLIIKLNRPKSADDNSLTTNKSPRAVQSFHPKCDEKIVSSSELINSDTNEVENKLKTSNYMSLFYDLKHSSISKPGNVVFKSNLRLYVKNANCVSGCKSSTDNDDNDEYQLTIYEVLSRVTFLPFKEVVKKQQIETIKFNRCCNQLITFDVSELVQKWILYPDSNNGILLELTDSQGNRLNIDNYIHKMDCSDKSPAVPYIKMIHPDLNMDLVTKQNYPTIDVAFYRNGELFQNGGSKRTHNTIHDKGV